LAAVAPEPRWSLPAAPATDAVRNLLGEPGFSTSDIEEFARGLGLDPALTEQLVAGRVDDLDITQIAQLCESLQCSPYDVWEPELARSILHVYGPENWPRRIEPLDDDRTLPTTDDAFLRRRLADRAGELAVPIAAVASRWADASEDEPPCTQIEVTCFRRVAVLAVSPDGISVVRDPTAAPDPGVEYHFSFRQVAEPQSVAVAISPSDFASGPLPGFDTDPDLAVVAAGLRTQPRLSEIDLVRMVDPSTGAAQWLGWDTDADSWQTWDDPRQYYPGDPADVLSTVEAQVDQLRLDALTSTSALDERGCGCVLTDSSPSLDL
jgi:DNA-binding Xre family transcriptional regulator